MLFSIVSLVNTNYGDSAFTTVLSSVPSMAQQHRGEQLGFGVGMATTTLTSSSRSYSNDGCGSVMKLLAKKGTTTDDGVDNKSNSGGGRSKNELIRPIRVDLILGPRKRVFNTEVKAEEEERIALAKRFGLSDIAKLDAELSLRGDGRHAGGSEGTIYAQGTIIATCTQTCVRTNEGFDVDLEFDFSTVVRPLITDANSQESAEQDEEAAVPTQLGGMDISQFTVDKSRSSRKGGNGRNNKKNKRREMRGGSAGQTLDQFDIKQLQDLLKDIDIEDDIIEDESVWGGDGILDVGELVAQLFRLKLDPYPKKPGSEPVSYSITG